MRGSRISRPDRVDGFVGRIDCVRRNRMPGRAQGALLQAVGGLCRSAPARDRTYRGLNHASSPNKAQTQKNLNHHLRPLLPLQQLRQPVQPLLQPMPLLHPAQRHTDGLRSR